ncbi:MFS transporter [Brachybacterium epidermidis]|uniref:MFS transporter n=1 Tax=Brachybacterium epidermidis TaxID=2781983 RepID=UPI00398F80C3
MTKVTAWSSRDFRRIWGATTASALGNEVGELALPVLALVWLGASAEELSWVRVATFLPYLALTLWIGVLVDRHPRRPLLIGAEAVSACVLLTTAGLALVGSLTIPMLIAAAAVLGSMAVLHMLADFSFVPLVVSREQLADANARITATQSAIGIGGSGVGGALVQWMSAPFAVALNGIGRFVAVALICRVRTPEPTPEPSTDSTLRQASKGLAALARHRVVRSLAAEATAWNLGNEVLMLALTVAVVQGHPSGPLALGVILMAGGIGAFLGASLSAQLTATFGYGRSLIAAMALGNTAPLLGVLLASDTSTRSLVVLGVALLASGVGVGVANSQAVTVRQLTVPEPLRGRVNAAYRMLSWGALAIGALLAGSLVTTWSWWPAAIVGATLMAASTLPVALSPVRGMRDLADPS